MNYYAMFILYIGTGVLITGAMFIWAVKRGQFSQANRARYLALEGIDPIPRASGPKKKMPGSVLATILVATSGLLVLLTLTLVIALG